MIKVAPEGRAEQDCGWTGWGCDMCTLTCADGCSVCTCTGVCTQGCSYRSCVTGTDIGAAARFHGGAGGLAELKAALKQQLEAVEEQERRAEGSLGLRSIEEAEMLEAKLEEALQEVRQAKTQLGEGSAE